MLLQVADHLVLDLIIHLRDAGFTAEQHDPNTLEVSEEDERKLGVVVANWESIHGAKVELAD